MLRLKGNENEAQLKFQFYIIENKNKDLKYFSANLEEQVATKSKELIALNKDLVKKNVKLEQFAFAISHTNSCGE